MTSSIRSNPSRPAGELPHAGPERARAGRSAFTLVELLVVMGIIVVLIGLIFPSLGAAWKGGVRQRMTADLNAISMALEAYKQDWSDYPRVYADNKGPEVLTMALVGPGNATKDGQDGPGWRPRGGGKLQQPYLAADKFKLVDPTNPRNPNPDLNTAVLGDRYSMPILYYPADRLANPAVSFVAQPTSRVPQGAGTWTGPRPMFNANDNLMISTNVQMPADQLQLLMGDWAQLPNDTTGVKLTPTSKNGKIDPDESPRFTGPFLLISAGPDEKFGFAFVNQTPGSNNRCDDVANFQRTEY